MGEYLRYNVIMSYTMSMYKISPNAGTYTKILFYTWRVICNLGLVSGMVLSIADIVHKGLTQINLMAVGIMNTVIFFSSLTRINYFYYNENKVESIVNTINTIFKHKTSVGLEEKTLEGYDKLTKLLVLVWSFSVLFTGEFMALLPLFFIGKTGKVLPLPLWYPYNATESPYYEITYFTQALTQFLMGFSYGISDMFFACITIMIAAQFELLGWELKNLVYTALLKQNVSKELVLEFRDNFDGTNMGKSQINNLKNLHINDEILLVMSTEKFKRDLIHALRSCVQYHQVLLDACIDLEDFFSPVLLPAMFLGISYSIFIMYSLANATSAAMTMSLLEYAAMAYAQIFCLTYVGQQLTSKTEEIRDYFYEMPWYLCDENFKKMFNIMQMKLTKPFIVTAWKFFDINLTTFLFAIKTSFSYFAFLRQVTDAENNQAVN